MKLAAITGSIGCGKTTLAKIASDLGYAVFDVDAWVRRIYRNKVFLQQLENLFKGSVKNGAADKKYLRSIVFNDKEKLEDLENLIYPKLHLMMKNAIRKNAKRNNICFLDIALLFEKGWDKYCDFIILADVDYEIQKQRVMIRDNISEDGFEMINNAQMNNEKKKNLVDAVVDTNKPINVLKVEMINIIRCLEMM
ncbi:MAG: dephospho-CoA kinase [Alphaproteobacteria bacterium]|nr:dephospho-CoA kinase [Alphaproteobacteria bacterium]